MLFTSEQVSAGLPDKVCDQISDLILSDCLRNDRNNRVAVETMSQCQVCRLIFDLWRTIWLTDIFRLTGIIFLWE